MDVVLSAFASFVLLYGLITLAFAVDYGVMLPKDLLTASERMTIATVGGVLIAIGVAMFAMNTSLLDSDGKAFGAIAVLVGPRLLSKEIKWLRGRKVSGDHG